ncbi:odorant receptor 83a-like [Cochliomyia hominivorax]
MDLEDENRQDLFNFMRIPMYYANMYPLHLEKRFPGPLKIVGFLLELIYEIFLYFVTIHIVIFHIYTIYLNYNKRDLDLLVNCLMQVIIYSWVILMKLYFRHLRYKVLKDLIDFMNLKYKTRSAIGFTYVTMDDTLALSNMFIKVYVYISIIGGLFWIIVPIAHGDRSLPLACWYPFDYKKSVIYEILYFLQSVGQFQVASAFCGSSGFHMILSILISGQYDILFCSLKNILATVAIERNASKSELRNLHKQQLFTKPEVNEFFCSKEITCKIDTFTQSTTSNQCRNFRLHFRNPFKKSVNYQSFTRTQDQDFSFHFRNAFKKCVDHHRYILECLNKMESFFSPIWFLKTGEIISVMCLLAFISVKVS